MSKNVYRVEGDYAREWFKDAIARRDKRLAVSDECFELSEVLNVDNRGFYTKSREDRGLWAFPFVKVTANGGHLQQVGTRSRNADVHASDAISDCIGLSVRQ